MQDENVKILESYLDEIGKLPTIELLKKYHEPVMLESDDKDEIIELFNRIHEEFRRLKASKYSYLVLTKDTAMKELQSTSTSIKGPADNAYVLKFSNGNENWYFMCLIFNKKIRTILFPGFLHR